MSERAPEPWATVAACRTPFEAHAIAALLRDEGFEAEVLDAAHLSLGGALGGRLRDVPVLVPPADLEAAREILAVRSEESRDIDWDSIDVGHREDDLPLRRPGRMPVLAVIGLIVAALIIVMYVVALAAGLF
jgi:hypothetical protein